MLRIKSGTALGSERRYVAITCPLGTVIVWCMLPLSVCVTRRKLVTS